VRIDLTAHEVEILKLLPKGANDKQIGHALGIGNNTVRALVLKIIDKLKVADRTEAAPKTIKRGLIFRRQLKLRTYVHFYAQVWTQLRR
jgi:DNA-binding NarL/FixJ family response regulator